MWYSCTYRKSPRHMYHHHTFALLNHFSKKFKIQISLLLGMEMTRKNPLLTYDGVFQASIYPTLPWDQ